MKKKRLFLVIFAVTAVVAVAALATIISFNVLVGGPVRHSGTPLRTSCTSIALFGKLETASVDKVVISSKEKSLTISDRKLVKQIVEKTKVANMAYNTGCGCCEQRGWKIDLYRGDRLVRSMDWLEDDIVKVYDCDLTHWVFPVEVQYDRTLGGYALLSEELEMQLHELFMNPQ